MSASTVAGAPSPSSTSNSKKGSQSETPSYHRQLPSQAASSSFSTAAPAPTSEPAASAPTSLTAGSFAPLSLDIPPDDDVLEHGFINGDVSFSRRGSIMLGGRRFPLVDASRGQKRNHQHTPSTTTTTATATATTTSGHHPDSFTQTASTPNAPTTGTNITAPASSRPASQGNATPIAVTPPPQVAMMAPPGPATSASSATPRDSAMSQEGKDGDKPAGLLPPPDICLMPADVESDSRKVRSLYTVGESLRWEDGAPPAASEKNHGKRNGALGAITRDEEEEEAHDVFPPPSSGWSTPRSRESPRRVRSEVRKNTELAGGVEDWDDLESSQVDRYGFITAARPPSSRLGTPTELKSDQFSPRRRRKNVLQKRDPHQQYPASLNTGRAPSRKVSARSLNTVNSGTSHISLRSSRSVFRQAGNLLPQNRDRRWMDEASDMLTMAPSLQDVAEEIRVAKISDAIKKKEIERTEKWGKMAKARKGTHGEGTVFEFDVKNPKLVERTWKGIPDRWRAAAWWSFMATSARNDADSPTEEAIVLDFHRLQDHASPDDVQIDLDVPRTISQHIMFRRRYRGGQRLLFRVLHALSLYYPQTGYVQGMASLAATLLSYFDEEKAFVMLVRMWRLRGLDRLYRPGFEGLMVALREFDTDWLNKDVSKRLEELGIDSTAYGTRWYLTLFNLSIPFPAQLRIWDVFLLLGDTALDRSTPSATSANGQSTATNNHHKEPETTPPTGLSILHAAAAALIDALREQLLDSDFENAMRALTSFISVKDEEYLMKVAKAEWRTHQQGGKKS